MSSNSRAIAGAAASVGVYRAVHGDAIVLCTMREVAVSRERVYNETVSYFPCLPALPTVDRYSLRVCENTFPVPRAQYRRMQPGKEDGLLACIRVPSTIFATCVYAPHPRDAHAERCAYECT